MVHRIHVNNQYSMPIPPMQKNPAPKQAQTDFGRILQDASNLKISKHAKERMSERNITFNEKTWNSISEKVHDAHKKGVTDSIVLTTDAALLVSTKNNTVITAMDRHEATGNIFTNINGAIVINE